MPDDVAREAPAVRAHAWSYLVRSRIFFAHQSVGQNIVDGVAALQGDRGASGLAVVELCAEPPPSGPFFCHARLGQNGDPKSKTDAFVAALESGIGDRVDVAFQKYCFVDIDATTDVRRLFDYYRQAMVRVHQRFPRLGLLHVTTPLTVVQSGPKAQIKKLLGRMPDHYADNIAREEYNELMRREFAASEPVFDLAALESRPVGGSARPVRFKGRTVHALMPESASDGGHLNGAAQKRAADALLTLLDRVLRTADRTGPWPLHDGSS